MKPLIGTWHRASMARANITAVEDMLDRQLHIWPCSFPRNLDTVAKGRHRAMRPARSTVLWDVLVQGLRAVVDAVLVTPSEISRIATFRILEVQVGWVVRRVALPNYAKSL